MEFSLSHIGTVWIPKVFTDSNSKNQSDLWECLVKLSKVKPNVWILGSAKKPILSKYLKFLATGCHGLGNLVYPCQLVIFSLLPRDLMEKGFIEFSKEFLAACWKGFFCKSIHNDSQEFAEMVLEVSWYIITNCHAQGSSYTLDFVQIGFVDPLISTFEEKVYSLALILEY